MSYLARSTSEIEFLLAQATNLWPRAPAVKRLAEVEAWLAIVTNQELLETHWGMERMWQHSHGTVKAAIHVILGQKHL